jgi:hypothetical protein
MRLNAQESPSAEDRQAVPAGMATRGLVLTQQVSWLLRTDHGQATSSPKAHHGIHEATLKK